MFQETKELTVTEVTAPKIGQFHEIAEDIRAGCLIKPVQCFGFYSHNSDEGCVMHAQHVGRVSRNRPPNFDEWNGLQRICPICPEHAKNILVHLNDDHLWTRERIADWVDTL